jgi:hypothetical protein
MGSPTLPAKVLRNVVAMGLTGGAWLERLSGLIQDLERRWRIRVGETLPNATEAYVAGLLYLDVGSIDIATPFLRVAGAWAESSTE